MQPLDLLITMLAAFYWSFAVSSTHGPFNIFDDIRKHAPLGGLTGCLVCLSIWFALLFFWLLSTPLMWITWVSAMAGGSVFIWRWTGADHV